MADPTADDVRKANMFTLGSAHAVYVEVMRRNFGKKGLEALGEANRLHGLELGQDGVKSGGLRVGDLGSIYEFFNGGHPYFGFEIELTKSTKDVLEMKVTACPWLDAFKAKKAGQDVCSWVCKMDEGIGQAVDPSLRLSLPKCMMRGDNYCVYRFSK
jgi:hypothetical protein